VAFNFNVRRYIQDDVLYTLEKAGVDSFNDCPDAPNPQDFKDEDGASLDLAARKADYASMLTRPQGMEAKWPTDLPGLWKGKILADKAGPRGRAVQIAGIETRVESDSGFSA
jgi:hypothetical protein